MVTNKNKPFQLNGYKVKFSKTYCKWQVSKGKIILEEFKEVESARLFCKLN